MNKLKSFPPLVGSSPRVLLLGSMPGVQSLQSNEYYAHPRNHFWALLSAILQSKAPIDYTERCDWLCSHHIALWDSVYRCVRKGSQDANIKQVEPNDISNLLTQYPSVQAIFFNGTASKKYFEKFHSLPPYMIGVLLPSSSPIPRPHMITVQDKLLYWLKIQDYI